MLSSTVQTDMRFLPFLQILTKNHGFCQAPQKPQFSVKIHKNYGFVYPIDSFQRPYHLIFALCIQLTSFKTIWPNFRSNGHMVLKGVNYINNNKIRSNGLVRSNLGTQYKNQVIWFWKESIGYTIQKLDHMVLKGVNWIYNAKIRSYGLERSQLGTQCKNWVIWSWKESIVYTMIKSGHMVLKVVNWVYNDKIRSNGLERSQFGYTMQKSDHMVLKGVNGHTMIKTGHMVLKGVIGYTMIKLGQMDLKGVIWVHNTKSSHMVLKGVNWVHNTKIRSYGLERSQLCTQCKNQEIHGFQWNPCWILILSSWRLSEKCGFCRFWS